MTNGPYLLDAEKVLRFPVPEIRATALSREKADKCAIACTYADAIEKLTGIRPEVRVLRSKLRVRVGDGPWYRWENGRRATASIVRFDDPDDGVYPAGEAVFLPPRDRDPVTGKVPGGGHGKDAAHPRQYVVSRSQNHNRRRSV